MQSIRRSLLGIALLGGVGRVKAARPVRSRAALLDAELAAIAADPACTLASLSVLAIRQGDVAYQGQFGQRFLGSGTVPALPANADTLYRIASISKLMTSLGAMRLVEARQLLLDKDVSDYLGFSLRNPAFPDRAITLRHLLSHTSTLRDDAGYSWPCATSLQSVMVEGNPAMWSPAAPPGAFFTYCNLGWGVIGTIMERVTGERFDRLMQRLLLGPLGMGGGYNPSTFPPADLMSLATLYRKRTTDTERWDPAGPWIAQVDDVHLRAPVPPPGIDSYRIGSNATPFSPTGGLRASAAGLGKVMLMLMNEGRHEGAQQLEATTLAKMREPHWIDDGKGGNGDNLGGLYAAWGLGTQLFPERVIGPGGFAGVGHLGEAYGLMSVFAADLANKNGLIVLVGGVSSDPAAQRATRSALSRFEERILDAMHRRILLNRAD